jgi:diguanylate cyclase (GGDEF)-like protein/PAS domain S-box-containing protein
MFTACIRDLTESKASEERLRAAEFRYRTLVEQQPLITYVSQSDNPQVRPGYISPQVEAVLGYSPEEWLAVLDTYERSIHEDDRERVLEARREAYARGEALRLEYRMRRVDGDVVWIEDRSVLVEPPDGSPAFRQGFALDITERKHAEEALRGAEGRFRALVEQLPLAVYVDRLDEASSNIYSSPHIESMLGFTPEEWVADGELFLSLLHPEDREQVLAAHARTHATGEPLQIEYRFHTRDGRVVWVHDEARVIEAPDGTRVLQGYLLDVTDRREAEEQLRHQAFHDALTGLANRALFSDRVEHALVRRAEEQGDVAVLILDLDDFKAINDSFGHAAGDALLKEVGERVRAVLTASHTVARIGGDEFAILIEDPSGLPEAVGLAERLLAQLELPFQLDGREVFVTPSIGIAVGREHERLLGSADVALYRAKTAGGAQYAVYGPKMDQDVLGRLELISDLRRARVEKEFTIHYQPIVELASGRLIGVEALARWQHPQRGLLQPAEFIPVAEETGRIVEIGRWVLGEACRQAAEWKSLLPPRAQFSVSVNVSTRQVRGRVIVEDVQRALAGSRREPAALTVEITESVLAERREELVEVLDEVAGLGVSLALDDFGTGYSSLPLLQDLPVHVVKVDRHFVGLIGTGRERTAFVRAIVELARALGLQVVAEGIESPAHVAVLRDLGCRMGQGFHFARPLEASQLDELLADRAVPRFPSALATLRAKVA